MQKHVLIVDDNTTNLKLAENTLKPHYKVTLLISGEQALKFLMKNRPDKAVTFVDNHDVDRIGSTLKNPPKHLYLLYALEFMIPGIPSIYYGSEWGIKGKRNSEGDYELRPCVPPFVSELPSFSVPDFDYAFWIDANSKVTTTTLNDITTILDALRDNKLPQVDTIFSTLGMWNSQERQDLKQEADYFDNVHLVPAKLTKNYDWMHGLIIKNFKKYYNQEFYVDERCDVMEGTAEDVYFSRLLRRVTKAYIAPTVVWFR